MPAAFKLTAKNTTYDLSTNGSFTEGARTGSWSVLDNGHIEIRPAAGGAPETVPAEWGFDAKNHLVVMQAGKVALDFTASDSRLEMELAANVLQVWPNRADNFKIELAFVWSAGPKFKDDGKLKASLNGTDSLLAGKMDRTGNRLHYVFRRTDAAGVGPAGLRPIRLTFTGTWKNSDAAGAGGLEVWFEYAVGDAPQKFQFPAGSWNIDATKGTLYLEYGSGPGRQKFEIAGDFQLKGDARLSFSFTHEVAGGTVTNTLTFATEFDIEGQTDPARLSLSIADTKAPGGKRTVAVKGKFSYQGNALALSINFTAEKVMGGGPLPQPVNVAIVLGAKIEKGGNVTLEVKVAGRDKVSVDLKVTDLVLSNGVGVTGGLNLTVDGKDKYVSGFLAFSW